MVAYKVNSESGIHPLYEQIEVVIPEEAEDGYIQIWFAIPWGCVTPSSATPPGKKKTKSK